MKYQRKMARIQWRKSFNGNNAAWRHTRQAGRTQSFRLFNGRDIEPAEVAEPAAS